MIEPIDAVFFYGTGTVVHAWEPVLRALAKKYGPYLGKEESGKDLASRWLRLHGLRVHSKNLDRQLANWVFGVRVGSARYAAFLRLVTRRDPNAKKALRVKAKKADDDMRAELLDLKKTIASELRAAQESGETHVRQGAVGAAARDLRARRSVRFAILTANWDLTLERWIRAQFPKAEPKVFHVHGSIEEPARMLLPGEAPLDIHRDKADNQYFRANYEIAMGHFAYAKRVYVVGLGLSTPDAALGAALNDGLLNARTKRGEVVVVNRKNDMKRIVAQVRVVIPDGWRVRRVVPPED